MHMSDATNNDVLNTVERMMRTINDRLLTIESRMVTKEDLRYTIATKDDIATLRRMIDQLG